MEYDIFEIRYLIFYHKLQKMQHNNQFQQTREDFQHLIRQGSLPPKMQLKLNYLQSSIIGKQLHLKVIQSLPQFQKLSLQMMNTQSKISLFVSIVKCLSGKQIVSYFHNQKAYIKKQDSHGKSVSCYLSCTSQSLTVSKNKDLKDVGSTFLIEKLLVAKMYHKEKKKFFFGIAYDNVKYTVKFDQEGPCARIHNGMLTAIRQKKALKSKFDPKYSNSQSKMQQQLYMESWDQTGGERMLQQQKVYLCSLVQKIQQSDIHSNDGYQLVRNIDGGKTMSNSNKNTVKVLMFMQRCTIQGLIQSYVQFGAWNIQVDSFRIAKKIRHNTFVGHMKMKKKNFYSSARQGYFIVSYFKMCPCLNPDTKPQHPAKHYLIFTNIPQTQQQVNGPLNGVSMSFNQTLQFSQVQSRPGVVFLNMTSSIDFNFYQYLQNSLELNLDFIEQVQSISVLCHEREMIKSNKTQLFEYNICVCDRRRQKQRYLFPANSVKQSRQNSVISEISQHFPDASEIPNSMSHNQIVKTITDNNRLIITDKIVDIIKNKIYQNYYLRQRFSQEVEDQPYIASDYHLNQKKQFLMLGTRWKLTKSQQFVFIDQYQLQLQKGILKLIVKQITANLMAGKSIMTMSLPVQIFDDYSTVQGFLFIFGFVPVFMHKALKETKIQQQIKYVAMAFMFMFACNPKVSKPFNPILGQTCQATIGGIPIFMEQISHHPPISAYLMKTDKFQISGVIDVQVDLGLNSANTKLPTPIKVKIYQNNAEYIIRMPEIQIGGIMFGDRALLVTGRGYALEKKSGIYLEYAIGKDKKKLYEYKQKIRKPDLTGGIFKITKSAVERILALDKKKSFQGIKHDQAIERTSLITGKWYGDIFFDGICYKSMKDGPYPTVMQRPPILLPSDCTFRLDIVYRRWRDFKKSNEEKQVLQNLQRRDRKLREKYHPQH